MHARGFTLLELLVAVTVATILLTIGVPSFFRMISENQRLTNSADVFSALNYARSEAIARNNEVVMCPSADEATCGGDWHQGWIIYVNLDRATGGAEPDNDEPVIRTHAGLQGNFTLTSDDFPARAVYLPSGRPVATGRFRLCPGSSGSEGRAIEVTSTGRPRTASLTCGGGG